MVLQLPGCCPLEQLSRSLDADFLSDCECHWRIVYNSIQQILSECKSSVALSDFECLLGTEWLSDSVIAVMIDCLKRGIPLPVSDVASTLEPASRWRILGQRARCIDLDEVCILDSAMGRRILIASRTRDYGDVLRVFSKQCTSAGKAFLGEPAATGSSPSCIWKLAKCTCTIGSRRHTTSTKSWQVWHLATPQLYPPTRMVLSSVIGSANILPRAP